MLQARFGGAAVVLLCSLVTASLSLAQAAPPASPQKTGAAVRSDGETLFGAAMDGHVDVVRAYLDKGAPVNASDDEGHTLLMYAAIEGRSEVVRLLVERGAAINAKDKDGKTALMTAAYQGHAAAVAVLLEKGADWRPRESGGRTALGLAQLGGRDEVVRLLKARGAANAFAGQLQPELERASDDGNVAEVRSLLDRGADIEARDFMTYTPLIRAASSGRLAIVRVLLERGADVDARTSDAGETALWWAAVAGQVEVVKVLLAGGADARAKDNHGLTPLAAAEAQRAIELRNEAVERVRRIDEVIRLLKGR